MYVGIDRFDVRRRHHEDLEAEGLVEKVEDYVNKVGHSERTGRRHRTQTFDAVVREDERPRRAGHRSRGKRFHQVRPRKVQEPLTAIG